MRSARSKTADQGRARAESLVRRIGRELRLARLMAGLTQQQVATRAGVSQATVSRLERGVLPIDLEVTCRVATAVGHELGARLYPSSLVGLRDSGQLGIAQLVVRAMASPWSPTLEVPVSQSPDDRRAIDLVGTHPDELAAMEVERWLADGQAQLRSAQLKREALSQLVNRPVRLILVVRDTPRNRIAVREHAALIDRVLPVPPERIWRALRSGEPIGGDGVLWVRERRRAMLAARASAAPAA